MAPRWAPFGCALALVAGCEAFFPLDDLGPTAADGARDANGPPTDGEATDVGSPDVADAAIGACDAFCPCLLAAPSFCEDFEKGDLSAWATTDTAKGGTATIVPDDAAPSPTHTLRIEIPSVDAGGRASLHKDFSVTTMTELECEFDVRALQWTDDQVISFDVTNNYSVGLVFSNLGVGVFEEPTQRYSLLNTPPLPPNAWQHVYVRLLLAQTPTIFVSFGAPDAGAPVYMQTLQAPSEGKPSFDLGGVYVQNSPSGWHAHFDNVVLRFQ